jgi:hypothetical protein
MRLQALLCMRSLRRGEGLLPGTGLLCEARLLCTGSGLLCTGSGLLCETGLLRESLRLRSCLWLRKEMLPPPSSLQ